MADLRLLPPPKPIVTHGVETWSNRLPDPEPLRPSTLERFFRMFQREMEYEASDIGQARRKSRNHR